MPRLRDKIVVVDIEATCWETDPPPDGQENEIIEVGICLFDVDDHQLSDKRSIFVKPVNSVVSPFCTKLTTITQEQVDSEGIDYTDACNILLKEYKTKERLWLSWGFYDQSMFREQSKKRGVKYPFGKKHVNLKRVFADLNGGNRVGMARAMKIANLELEGVHHRGDDDAWNIARILRYLIETHGQGILAKYW